MARRWVDTQDAAFKAIAREVMDLSEFTRYDADYKICLAKKLLVKKKIKRAVYDNRVKELMAKISNYRGDPAGFILLSQYFVKYQERHDVKSAVKILKNLRGDLLRADGEEPEHIPYDTRRVFYPLDAVVSGKALTNWASVFGPSPSDAPVNGIVLEGSDATSESEQASPTSDVEGVVVEGSNSAPLEAPSFEGVGERIDSRELEESTDYDTDEGSEALGSFVASRDSMLRDTDTDSICPEGQTPSLEPISSHNNVPHLMSDTSSIPPSPPESPCPRYMMGSPDIHDNANKPSTPFGTSKGKSPKAVSPSTTLNTTPYPFASAALAETDESWDDELYGQPPPKVTTLTIY